MMPPDWLLEFLSTTPARLAATSLIIVVTAVVTRSITKRKIIGKINFMSDALSSGESMFRYSLQKRSNRTLNFALNRLRGIFEDEKEREKEREKYFELMLDHVQSGVIVLNGEKVEYCNDIARSFLGMADISKLRQIERISPELAMCFRSVGETETKATFQSERGTVHFSVNSCMTKLHSNYVKIVTFNDITMEMENNESESWTKLIRVLTHEIMNTVTPIATLSSALSQNPKEYNDEELRSALTTIASSSEGLISFVQSYRSLTHIATPVRKAFYFSDIAHDSINIAGANWPSVNVRYEEFSENIILYADQGQLSQVINNLVKNAAQAEAKNITITAEINKRDQVVINVSNDGNPISKSCQEQLFVPFFTTKGSGGTGVGLSLARQLIRLNGGTISLTSSTTESTIFTIAL